MLKLHQIYFRKLFTLFIVLFFIVGGVVYYWMQDVYIANIKKSLGNDIKLIELGIGNKTNLDKLSTIIKHKLGIRITFISKNGLVLAESDKNKKIMNNHKNRPEIIEARKNGVGYSIRRSITLGKNLFYVAKKYKYRNKIIYIRLAKEIKKIYSHLMKLALKIAFILILFFIILFFIIYKIGKEIEFEVDKISKFLINLTKKKKKIYIKSDFSYEFYKITKLLTKVASILSKRDKQKARYTARLKDANKQKDDIISAISHEFKNPITVINGYSKTLLDDVDIEKEIAYKFLQKIHANGEKLSHLIDTLRLSVKLDDENIKLKFSEFNLYDIVEESAENLKITYPEREIFIDGNRNITIKADKVLFGVAITNLIENAIKYSEEKVQIVISSNSIAIKDYGIGIHEKELKNIIKKFYRVSRNCWNNSLGLGLSIVTNILNLHDFKLEIKSQKNEGSEFIIIF